MVRPGEGIVEDIERRSANLVWSHHLDVKESSRIITSLDCIEKVPNMKVRISTSKPCRGCRIQGFDSAFWLPNPFDVNKVAVLLCQGVCVYSKPIDMPKRSWYSTLTEQMHECMDALRVVHMVIPEHVVVRHIGSRMLLVTPIHAWELDRVTQEKDREVVKDKILIAVFGVELSRPTSHVSDRIGRTLLASYCGNTSHNVGLLSNLRKEASIGKIGNIIQDFEEAKGTGGLSMHHPIGLQYGQKLEKYMITHRSGMRSREKWARTSMS